MQNLFKGYCLEAEGFELERNFRVNPSREDGRTPLKNFWVLDYEFGCTENEISFSYPPLCFVWRLIKKWLGYVIEMVKWLFELDLSIFINFPN